MPILIVKYNESLIAKHTEKEIVRGKKTIKQRTTNKEGAITKKTAN